MSDQTISINFAEGIETKTDPWQLPLGQFLDLENAVFTKGKRLTKRNGYVELPSLPDDASFGTTFNGNLTAIGSGIEAYSTGNQGWVTKGNLTPLSLSTLPLIRNNLNQTQVDTAVAENGLVCTVYSEINNTTTNYKYVISNSVTGQNIVAPTLIATNETNAGPKVFVFNNYFIILYNARPLGADNLFYIAIASGDTTLVTGPVSITSNITPSPRGAFDAVILGGYLYISWNGGAASGIHMVILTPTLQLTLAVVVDAAHSATVLTTCVDTTNSIVYVSYYDSVTSNGYTVAVNSSLVVQTHFPTQMITGLTVLNLTSVVPQAATCQVFYEVSHTASGIQTNFVSSVSITQSSGAVSSAVVILRSVGIASKAFIVDGTIYFLAAYSSAFQPTYFLVNATLSRSSSPVISAKLAYENGGGYLALGLPSVSLIGSVAYFGYLIKDLIQALGNANSAGTSVVGGVYSQVGINLASFDFTGTDLVATEIGLNLNISGGYLLSYDGYSLTEQGFHLWPDSVQAVTATTTGFLAAQKYFYQVTYEWSDNQGNIFRSAGSIPLLVDLSGSGTATNKVTLTIPTLRITQKVSNPVKIVVYRWSTAQQVFYQTSSILAPTLNDTTVDSVTFVDIQGDASILGNNILYSSGNVIENIGPPSTSLITLFDDRLWLVDSEDQNLLWYSKQVIESTPVEMSDLLTIYVNPNVGSTGPTGPISALSVMDDKLIIYKQNAINYIAQGSGGPDNTGANSGYSQPLFVTSMVGCSNQKSIVFQPEGLMFEFSSEAGNQIWILTRGLGTQYIGSSVEALTKDATVLSAIAVPGTNEVRFNLSSGITLKYDYFYGKWGLHSTSAISSTLFQNLHTYIDSFGRVFQETPGLYLDGTEPVLMSFKTGWINLAGLQGFQRFKSFYFIGQYFSPHLMNVGIAYDYNESIEQIELITPDNYSSGTPSAFGDQPAPFGSPRDLEQWKIHPTLQKCRAFQLVFQEVFDPTFGTIPGQGFSLSGLNMVVDIKRGTYPIRSANTAGG